MQQYKHIGPWPIGNKNKIGPSSQMVCEALYQCTQYMRGVQWALSILILFISLTIHVKLYSIEKQSPPAPSTLDSFYGEKLI